MFENEEAVAKALEDGTATAAGVWEFALSNKLNEGGKKALDAERDARKTADSLAKDLQKQLDEANSKLSAVTTDGLPEWQKQIDDLKTQITSEREARETAEKTAETERVAALRARLGKDLPEPIAALLTGTTEDEIKTQVEALAPHVAGGGPKPNPQQGNPSLGRDKSGALGLAEAQRRFGDAVKT